MKIEELKNKKILILGYGKEGRSTEDYLKKALSGASIDHTDRNSDPHYLERQKDYDLIIKTPGFLNHWLLRNTPQQPIFFCKL